MILEFSLTHCHSRGISMKATLTKLALATSLVVGAASTAHADNNFAGFTWGQQALPALRDRFGCSRMDKAFYCGAVRVQSFETFGADVEVDPRCQRQRDALLALGFEKAWVTDHLGIVTTFSLANDTRL